MNRSYHVPLWKEEVGADVFKEMSETLFQPHVFPPNRSYQVPKPLKNKGTMFNVKTVLPPLFKKNRVISQSIH